MNMVYVLSVIDSLRAGWYDAPSSYNRKKINFMQQSYRRSAMDEIKFYLMEHKNEDPIQVIENFCNMMDKFSCNAKNKNISFMFSVYYDVANDVLDVLLGMM